MKILFLSQVLPYPIDAGPKVRSFYNISYLSQKHSITLLSFIRGSDTKDAVSYLKTICQNIETVQMPRSRKRDIIAAIKSLLTGRPFLITRDYVAGMEQKLLQLVRQERFDVIHADQLWMAPYALMARAEAEKIGYTPKLILDQHNAVFMIPKRMAASSQNPIKKLWLLREAKLMEKYETWICSHFDRVVWVTQQDLAAVQSINPIDLIKNSNNGKFDKNIVIPICFEPIISFREQRICENKDILFLGGMHWPPNADGVRWFMEEIFPRIINEIPKIRFLAVGKQPPRELLSKGNQIIAPGYVTDVTDYWSSAGVFIVPLRAGGGMRVKILDAWAKGVPVVSTTIGAEGINYSEGNDILIADKPEDFAEAVIKVMNDQDLALRLGKGGKCTLEEKYDWRRIYPAWDMVYDFKMSMNPNYQKS
jgi:glycosyltransferase involved in cell wall biosynthesis